MEILVIVVLSMVFGALLTFFYMTALSDKPITIHHNQLQEKIYTHQNNGELKTITFSSITVLTMVSVGTSRRLSTKELMPSSCGTGEDS